MIKKRKSIILSFIFILSLLIQLTVIGKAIPFSPIPISPYQDANWGVDIGDIFRWNISSYEGQELLGFIDNSFKINGTDFITFYDDYYYCLTVRKMLYNESTDIFYEDPAMTSLFNFSLINFTIPKMYPFQGGQPITVFIPKLHGNLMTEWVANASYFQYKLLFDPNSPPQIFTNSNTIRYYNKTTGDVIEFQYCNDGSLKTGYWYFGNFQNMYNDYRLEIEQLYPKCDDAPSSTINIGFSFLLYIFLAIMSLVVFLFKKNKIKNQDI